MYLLLLIGHMTLAVTATTPGMTTQNLQTHISQSDAVTKGHVDASSKHAAATTGAQGAHVTHTGAVTATTPGLTTQDLKTHISQSESATKGHVDASSKHAAATTGAKGAPVIHTEAATKGHVDASSKHIAATTGAQGAPVIHTEAATKGHVDASSKHITATTGVQGAPVVHTVAVPATTPGLTTQDLQTHVSQSDAVTKGHVDASSKHAAATTGAKGAPVIHTEAVTKGHVDASSKHIAATTGVQGAHVTHTVHRSPETQTHVAAHQGHVPPTELPTTKVPADHKVSVHHSTHVSHSDSVRRHSTVIKKELPSTLSKPPASQVIMGSESVPVLSVDIIDKIHHFTCIWDLGPQDTHYELVQRDTMVENITVHGKEAAVFKYNIPQGPTELYCRVRTASGEMVISKPMRIMGDTTEGEGKAQDKTKTDTEERDASPPFLISMNKILTSVTQPVQELNIIIICVCGPVILIVILAVFIIHFRNRRERKLKPTVLTCAA